MNAFRWAIAASLAIGLAIGIGAYTFVYAKGGSYLTNDPAACANCHIMDEHYAAWQKSSHHAVAGCNDCHTRDYAIKGGQVPEAAWLMGDELGWRGAWEAS